MIRMRKNVVAAFVFLCVVFTVCRLRELVASSTGRGYLPSREVDPESLTIPTLRSLLDLRGIIHTNVVLKSGLEELAEATGNVTESEVFRATVKKEKDQTVIFFSGDHLLEDLQYENDTMWLVHVGHRSKKFLTNWDWQSLIDKVSKAGIRTGFIDCNLDKRFCDGKGWFSPRVMLILPQGTASKRKLSSYRGTAHTQLITEWIKEQISTKIARIRTVTKLEKDWLDFSDQRQNQEVRIILISSLKDPPLFYSVLSLMFEDSVRFGMINTAARVGQVILSSKNWTRIPSYKIITPEYEYDFGELPNYMSMRLFLQTLQPNPNNTFFLLLIFMIMSCCLSMAFKKGGICERMGCVVWPILFRVCRSPALLVLRLPYLGIILTCGHKITRLVSITYPVSVARADYLEYYDFYSLTLFFIMYSLVVGILYDKYLRTESILGDTVNRPTFSDTRTDSRPTFSDTRTSTRSSISPTPTRPTVGVTTSVTRPTFGDTSVIRPAVDVTSSEIIPHSNHRRFYTNNMAAFDEAALRMMDNFNQRLLARVALNSRNIPSLPVWRHTQLERDAGFNRSTTGTDFSTHNAGSYNARPPNGALRTERCTICLEQVLLGEMLCGLPCGHVFHEECIKRWLRSDGISKTTICVPCAGNRWLQHRLEAKIWNNIVTSDIVCFDV